MVTANAAVHADVNFGNADVAQVALGQLCTSKEVFASENQ